MKNKLKATLVLILTLILTGCQNKIENITLETVELDNNWSEYAYLNDTKYEYGTKLEELSHLGFDENLEIHIGVPVNDSIVKDLAIINELEEQTNKNEATLRIELKTQNLEDGFDGLIASAAYSTEKSNAGDGETTIGIGSTYEEVIQILGEPKEILGENCLTKQIAYENNGMKLTLAFVKELKLYKINEDIDVFKYNHKVSDNPHRNREKLKLKGR